MAGLRREPMLSAGAAERWLAPAPEAACAVCGAPWCVLEIAKEAESAIAAVSAATVYKRLDMMKIASSANEEPVSLGARLQRTR